MHSKAGKCGCGCTASVITLPWAVSGFPSCIVSLYAEGVKGKCQPKCFPFTGTWSAPSRFRPFNTSGNCSVIALESCFSRRRGARHVRQHHPWWWQCAFPFLAHSRSFSQEPFSFENTLRHLELWRRPRTRSKESAHPPSRALRAPPLLQAWESALRDTHFTQGCDYVSAGVGQRKEKKEGLLSSRVNKDQMENRTSFKKSLTRTQGDKEGTLHWPCIVGGKIAPESSQKTQCPCNFRWG